MNTNNGGIRGETELVFSVDVDWAPDWMVEQLAEQLFRRNMPVTWFATGESNTLQFLMGVSSHEVAIHPNFSPGSSHGGDYEAALRHMLLLYPKAAGFRSHSLHISSRILHKASEYGLIYDSNLLIESDQRVSPFRSSHGLVRFTHHYSDAIWLGRKTRDKPAVFGIRSGELNVFDFHPIHLWLGSNSLKPYERLKAYLGSKNLLLDQASESELVPFREEPNWPLLEAFFKQSIEYQPATFEQIAGRLRASGGFCEGGVSR